MQSSSLNCGATGIAVPVFTTRTLCLCCYRSAVLARLPPVYLCGGSQVIVERYTTRCSSCLVLHLCRSLMGLGFVAVGAEGHISESWESYRKFLQSLVKYKTNWHLGCFPMTLKYDRYFGRTAADQPAASQSFVVILTPNLTGLRLCGILRLGVLTAIETAALLYISKSWYCKHWHAVSSRVVSPWWYH